MTITIGRCVLPDPAEVSDDGTTITFSGIYYSTAATATNRAAEAQMREMQLLGMVDNPDEDVYPVAYSTESRYDGFYLCDGASWSWLNDGSARMAAAQWSVSLRPVRDCHRPTGEVSWLALRRTNASGLAPTNHYIRRRRDYAGWRSNVAIPWETATRTTSDGYALWQMYTTVNASRSAQFRPSPSTWYTASCSIEVLGADSVWYPLVGRTITDIAITSIRLTNGLARVTLKSTGEVTHSIYDSVAQAWEAVDFALAITPNTGSEVTLASLSQLAVVRNDPDACVIRFEAAPSVAADYDAYGSTLTTISLQAGEWWAGVVYTVSYYRSPATTIKTFAVKHAATTASTSITGGLRRTSNDAAGNRSIIATAETIDSRNLTTGALYATAPSGGSCAFMVAQALNGSSATGRNTEALIVDDWVATTVPKTRVVGV